MFLYLCMCTIPKEYITSRVKKKNKILGMPRK